MAQVRTHTVAQDLVRLSDRNLQRIDICDIRELADGTALPSAGTPGGAVGPHAAALLYAARWCGAKHGAANFLGVIGQSLWTHRPGTLSVDKAAMRIGAIAFIHRFGSSLNRHLHYQVYVVDGVFKEVARGTDADADADANPPSSPIDVIFHPASAIDAAAVT